MAIGSRVRLMLRAPIARLQQRLGAPLAQVWRWLQQRRGQQHPGPGGGLPSEAALAHRLAVMARLGVDVAAVQSELAELQRRRAAGRVVIALMGEISVGKSTLIKALVPTATVATSPVGGTTRAVQHYDWTSPAGDQLVLTDVPGLDEIDGELEAAAQEEALRAHLVVYICEGDLTRSQYRALAALYALQRPLIVALNKVDRYREEELALVRSRLAERLTRAASDSASGHRRAATLELAEGRNVEVPIVAIQAGGVATVVKSYPDGRRETFERPRAPVIQELCRAIQRKLDEDGELLEQLRDAAVFVLAQRKLDAAAAAHRRQRAAELIRQEVSDVLAMAATGAEQRPLGARGMALLQRLMALYEGSGRELDERRLLRLAEERAQRHRQLLLAVAAEALIVEPLPATSMDAVAASGELQAVVQGVLIESFGNAVARTLESRGELASGPALRLFEDDLTHDLETRIKGLARRRLDNASGDEVPSALSP